MRTSANAPVIIPVILCGGSGTRLWPLSRQELPKQFAPIFGARSLFEETVSRARMFASGPLICAGAEGYRHEMAERLRLAGADDAADTILEPEGRNTAAAIAAAALHAHAIAPDTVLVCLPSDHHISDRAAFAAAVTEAARLAADGHLVTLGVKPHRPATSFGYIAAGDRIDGTAARKVTRFVEKPAADLAGQLIAAGASWNAGLYVGRADVLLAEFATHAAEILAATEKAMAQATRDGAFIRPDPAAYRAIPSLSIDHAVAEKSNRLAVIPMDCGWSDVGTWSALVNIEPAADAPKLAHLIDCENTVVRGDGRVVAAVGLKDVIIVDTPDAVLVTHKDAADKVKDVVGALTAEGRPEVLRHKNVARPWGSYECIDAGPRYQVKRITVKPGGRLSLQYHHHRAEHWTVVHGTARVTNGDRTFLLSENESTYIPLGAVHRLENPGREVLELIEVQTGSYLGEDDIVRLEDTYGRS